MFGLANEALKTLSQWPVVEAFFIIVIAFCGIAAWRRGERDRKAGFGAIEVPGFLMIGPVHDAMTSVHNISETSRKIFAELEYHSELLESIRNNQELRPDPVHASQPTTKNPRRS